MLEDPILSSSGADAFNTAWVGSIAIGLTFLMSPIASICIDMFGCRKTALFGAIIAFIGALSSTFVRQLHLLYLTYGVVLGTGFSFAYTPSLVILGHYFKKRIGLANGLVTAGSGIFSMAFPLLLELMVGKLGLWITIGVISGFVFILIPIAATYRPLIPRRTAIQAPESNSTHETSCVRLARRYLNIEIWRNKRYVIWCIAIPIAMLGHFVKFVHLVNHVEIVSSNSNGAIVITCLSATSLIGRLVFGRIADIGRRVEVCGHQVDMTVLSPIVLQQIALFVDGFITMLLPFATLYFPLLVVLVLVMGLFDGCFVCMMGPVAFNIVGATDASQAIGFILGLMAIPGTIGPPFAGFIFDQSGSYYLAFVIAGVAPLIAACIMFLIVPVRNTVEQSEEENPNVDEKEREPGNDIEFEVMLDKGKPSE
ncbi:monocarboxylate transporter 10-like [Glandiceps talaboti]